MPTLGTLRRRAIRQGLRLHSVPERSGRYWEHGPYFITDVSTTGVLAKALAFDEVAPTLDELN